jgi:hypothetical protein
MPRWPYWQGKAVFIEDDEQSSNHDACCRQYANTREQPKLIVTVSDKKDEKKICWTSAQGLYLY